MRTGGLGVDASGQPASSSALSTTV